MKEIIKNWKRFYFFKSFFSSYERFTEFLTFYKASPQNIDDRYTLAPHIVCIYNITVIDMLKNFHLKLILLYRDSTAESTSGFSNT